MWKGLLRRDLFNKAEVFFSSLFFLANLFSLIESTDEMLLSAKLGAKYFPGISGLEMYKNPCSIQASLAQGTHLQTRIGQTYAIAAFNIFS